MTTTARRRLVAAAAATTFALTLGACSARDGSEDVGPRSAPTSTEASRAEAHNAADAAFAQMMIVHHEGAIEMAELVAERGERPEVVALARRIAAAQAPEIEQMSRWLESWGEPR